MATLPEARALELGGSSGPFQPKLIYDSVIHCTAVLAERGTE